MRKSLPAIALLMSLSLTACGGDDGESKADESASLSTSATSQSDPTPTSEPPPSSETPAQADPVEAMQAWVDAYADGDAKAACALQTEAYTKADLANAAQQGMIEDGATCEDGVAVAQQAMKAFGYDLSTAKVALVSTSGDAAKVSMTVAGESTTYGMALVDGAWLVDSEQ